MTERTYKKDLDVINVVRSFAFDSIESTGRPVTRRRNFAR